MYLMFWYWFADLGAIFPTSFDILCYYLLFLFNSLLLACHKVVEHFVVDQLDPQIIGTATVNLQRSELFLERAYKTIAYEFILQKSCMLQFFFIFWLFWNIQGHDTYAEALYNYPWLGFVLCAFPSAVTNFEIRKFRAQLHAKIIESKGM